MPLIASVDRETPAISPEALRTKLGSVQDGSMSRTQGEETGPVDDMPSDAEMRIAQSQIVDRLEVLFHGIQTTLFAQEMAAQQQLQSIVDVWAATNRYRAAGNGQGLGPIPGMPDGQVLPDGEPTQ
jgi:Protein of unknown function (DUF2587)